MARDSTPDIEPPDRIEGIALPRENRRLAGHDTARAAFAAAVAGGRLHHAWLLTGEPGIGKATFAFAMARALLSGADPAADVFEAPPEHPALARIAAGTHPNLLHLQRAWNRNVRRHRTELTVDEVRRIIPFLGTTAGEAGWRVVIVDTADEMNRNAANALLKSLEEPPKKALFFLVASRPDALIATIRSRCRRLAFAPLRPADMERVLGWLDVEPDAAGDRDALLALSRGSPRRAIELIRRDGLALNREIASILAADSPVGAVDLVAFARRAADTRNDTFDRFLDGYFGYLHRRIRDQGEAGAGSSGDGRPPPDLPPPDLPLVTWAALWEKATNALRDLETFNLDRSQFVLDQIETARAAIRKSARH